MGCLPKNLRTDVKKSVKVENPVVVVRYLNPDGTEVYSETFFLQNKNTRGDSQKRLQPPAGFYFCGLGRKEDTASKEGNFWK